jgi:hypothetical protein
VESLLTRNSSRMACWPLVMEERLHMAKAYGSCALRESIWPSQAWEGCSHGLKAADLPLRPRTNARCSQAGHRLPSSR